MEEGGQGARFLFPLSFDTKEARESEGRREEIDSPKKRYSTPRRSHEKGKGVRES
jgi:hypothetical protein